MTRLEVSSGRARAPFAVRADHAFDGERALPGGALVLVADGMIQAVEPAAAPVPQGYLLHEGPGGTLLPGLVDSHVHLCGDDGPRALDQLTDLSEHELDRVVDRALAAQLAAGVTTVRDLGDRGWAVADRHRRRPDGPRVLAAGPPITAPGGHCWYMRGEVDTAGDPAEAERRLRAAVRERAEHGADVVKIMTSGGMLTPGTDVLAPQFTVAELRAVRDEAHAAGLTVTGHAHALAAVELCLAAGLDGIEHCTCIAAGGYATPPDLADRLAAAGTAVCPTLGRAPGVQTEPTVQELLDRLGISWEGRFPHLAPLVTAGVRLLAGADSGIGPTKPHGVLPHAVADLVLAGATPTAALTAATSVSADACGVGDRTGRLRPGLSADLLLVEGDALAEVGAVTRPRLVVCRGELQAGRELP